MEGASARRRLTVAGLMRKVLAPLVALALAAASSATGAADMSFDRMRSEAHWDLGQPRLWGYFFVNPTRPALDKVVPLLTAGGYHLVDVHLGDKKAPSDPDEWWLHVERVEVQTVETLVARNQEPKLFAQEHGIARYDGWDVGPASSAAPQLHH